MKGGQEEEMTANKEGETRDQRYDTSFSETQSLRRWSGILLTATVTF